MSGPEFTQGAPPKLEADLNVLALNSGSSSLKFSLYRAAESEAEMLLSGEIETIGAVEGKFHARDANGKLLLSETGAVPDQGHAIYRIARLIADHKMPSPAAIGHRVVHGGPELRQHCRVDDKAFKRLNAATPFAPLHIPQALSLIRAAQEQFPKLPQVACFDTTFHVDLPDISRTLPIASELRAQGIQRYGFHGLSCGSIVRQLGGDLPRRLIIAHLGNGASITAIRDGQSIDTSMGLTPSGGVIMGTRSGDLDPGVLVYLAKEKNFDTAMLEDLVDHRSGLMGISDITSDMRLLHEAARSNSDAGLAIRMFCYSVRKQIAGMISALDGVDLIVFTGGIGENDCAVRAEICGGLLWMGISFDDTRNLATINPISDSSSRCRVLVLPSQEDEQIARHTWSVLAGD